MPMINARIFNPAPIPKRWLEEFPFEMTLRPAQIRAEAAEAAIMIPAAAALAPRFSELKMPVTIVAGHGDEMVTTASQSELLHAALPGSRFEAVKGCGHMVHHSATAKVLSAIGSA
jgi:pimeloyl-ACP methyl ester carboxylesterase